jgi:ABC-type transporter Mla maintaining outer membrane lipid asymmetry permease subunit MlaE
MDLSEIPGFNSPQRPVSEIVQAAVVDSSIIVFFSLGIFAAAFFSFLRFDVR